MQFGDGEGGHVVEEVLGDGAAREDQQAEHQGAAMLAEDFVHQAGSAGGLALTVESLGQVAADVDADRQHQQAEHEGHAPPPAVEVLGGQHAGQGVAHQAGDHRRDALGDHLPAGIGAALVLGGGFEDISGGRAGFSAPGQALDQPGQYQQNRCGDADAVVARQDGDAAGAHGHHHQGQQHRRFASDAVGVRTDQHRAERAYHKADAKGGDRQHQAEEGVVAGEEGVADHHGEGGVHPEIEKLHGIAQHHGKDAFAAGGALRR